MIYGIGSMYGATHDVLPDFLSRGVACVGWEKADAPAHYQMLGQIAVGDIIFVKSFPPAQGLYIKAVGIVDKPDIYTFPDLVAGRSVQWVWNFKDQALRLGRLDDHYDQFRAGTLYQELGPRVQAAVIDLLINRDDAAILREAAAA
jgi:hypothetical protein